MLVMTVKFNVKEFVRTLRVVTLVECLFTAIQGKDRKIKRQKLHVSSSPFIANHTTVGLGL